MVDLRAQAVVLGARIASAIDGVLDHQQFVFGPEVAALEQALATRTGAAEVVACANGTDALVLSLRALGVRPGDRVVVPAFTFAATAEAVVLVGAEPVFADIRADTFNLDAGSVEAHLGSLDGPQPVGVVAVDLFGHPADRPELQRVAAEHGWWVLTDAAQSCGAVSPGGSAGSIGALATTSFFPSKPLGAYGDGGAVFCPSGDHAEVLRSLRNHGAGTDRYDNARVGTNSRLDAIQAAVLLEKLAIFDAELEARERIARRYTEVLGRHGVQTPVVHHGVQSTWAQYTIRLAGRDAVASALDARGISTAVHYRSTLADQPAFAGAATLGDLPEARSASREVLSLPMHPYLSEVDQDRVLDAVRSATGTA
ncbi:MAG: DegT/DnrJ/EryC1/StrS family aminotransferase [Acidimicrobiales bacterium]